MEVTTENKEKTAREKRPRVNMKELYNFVYEEMVVGEVDWYDNDKGFGIIKLFDEVTTTEGDKVSTLFLHKNKYNKTSIRPEQIFNGDLLFCDDIIKTDKILGFSWHIAEWTRRSLSCAIETVLRHPDRRYLFVRAFSHIYETVTEKKLERLWKKLTGTKTEEELKEVLTFLSKIASDSNNDSIKTEINEVLTEAFGSLPLKSRLELWKNNVFSAQQFDSTEYQRVLSEGIDSKAFYEQLDDKEKTLFLKVFLNQIKASFDFKVYSNMANALKEEDCDEEDKAVLVEINSEKVIPCIFNTYLEEKGKSSIMSVVDRAYKKIPALFKEKNKEILGGLITKDILDNSSDTVVITSIIEGIIKGGSISMLKDIKSLEMRDCQRICSNIELFGEHAKDAIIDALFEAGNYEGAFECAKLIDDTMCAALEKKAVPLLSGSELFELWKKGYITILPKDVLLAYLDFDEEKDSVDNSDKVTFSIMHNRACFKQYCIGGRYKEWDELVERVKTNKEDFFKAIEEKMGLACQTYSRLSFQTYLNLIGYCLYKRKSISEGFVDCVFYRCSKWLLDVEYANADEVLDNLALYMPNQQIRVIKKLFQKFEAKEIENPLYKIRQALREETEVNDSNMPLYDLTSRIVIEALAGLDETGSFMADNSLFELLLSQRVKSKAFKFTVSDLYFDECDGRTYGSFHPDFLKAAQGKVEKAFVAGGDYVFVIMVFPHASAFEYIVDSIKEIPDRRWDETRKVWIVPSSREKEVMDFARIRMFSVDLKDGKLYLSNLHFYNFHKEDSVHHKKFCDGRPNNNPYYKSFWCDNAPCFKTCIVNHADYDWPDYTLYDFCRILGLDIREIKGNVTIAYGKYIQFVGRLNRFNDLLDRLYCKECGQLMYPARTSEFAKYSVTRFWCLNQMCPGHKRIIYLNKCFNGTCNAIIDSRDSKQCPNGWYICSECNMCCSTEKMKERLENLEFNQGYIPGHMPMQGHYEKKEFFCYQCGMKMINQDGKIWCANCGIEKDLPVYRPIRFTYQ